MAVGVTFNNTVGTTAIALGATLTFTGRITVCNVFAAIMPWAGNNNTCWLSFSSDLTKPAAGSPTTTGGIPLINGQWNEFPVPQGIDVTTQLFIIGGAAGQDFSVLGT